MSESLSSLTCKRESPPHTLLSMTALVSDGECRQLSSMSESIAQRVDVAVDMQQKANRILTHVLGSQYTLCKHRSHSLNS